MIMIVKTLGSQMGSSVAAEGGGEAKGGGRGESVIENTVVGIVVIVSTFSMEIITCAAVRLGCPTFCETSLVIVQP